MTERFPAKIYSSRKILRHTSGDHLPTLEENVSIIKETTQNT